MLTLLVVSGCLINTDAYEDRKDQLTDHDGDAFSQLDDCDDQDATIFPGAAEVCDAIDQDCDGQIDEDAVDAPTWYLDGDGDGYGNVDAIAVTGCAVPTGYASSADDCDDAAESIHPDAEDNWYDGTDSNCDAADDFDQDGDGEAPIALDGTDCDDEDATRGISATEGWLDIGIDNDCDGSTQDQVSLDTGSMHRIDGPAADAGFGSALVVVPTGWFDDEPWLLVGAGALDSYSGGVYAWPASGLSSATSASEAPWKVEGGGFLGYALGWAGEEDAPVLLVSEVTTGGTQGSVLGWTAAAIGGGREDASFVITGDVEDVYVGSSLLSGTDIDGDGIDDLVTSGVLDSRYSPNSGTVAVFYEPSTLTGMISYADSDALFVVDMPGAQMYPVAVGDANDDGRDDLGFVLSASSGSDPSGALFYSDQPTLGQHEVISESTIQFYSCAPHTAMDVDDDGSPELLALGGIVWQVDLPVSGSVVPWEPTVGRQNFRDSDVDWVGTLDVHVPFWDGARALGSSYVYDEGRGAVAIDRLAWGLTSVYEDDSKYLLHGQSPGDRFGTATGFLDHSGDRVDDLLIAAPGLDAGGADAGAVYIVPSPT
ncbi:MAG: MopE-related protein [Myxococcota bacterium]